MAGKRRRRRRKTRVHKSKPKKQNLTLSKAKSPHTRFNFVRLPNHKELERLEPNTWYPKTVRTITNSYSPHPIRVFE